MRGSFFALILVCSTLFLSAQEVDVNAWKQDIEQYQNTIIGKHKDPFTKIAKEDFIRTCDELISHLSDLDSQQVQVGLYKLVASIGDAHTTIEIPMNNLYPISAYWFSDGIKLLMVLNDQEELLGAEVTGVNGLSIDAVVKKLSAIIPHENKAQLKEKLPMLLANADVLYGVGIAEHPTFCSYTLLTEDGSSRTVNLEAVPQAELMSYRSRMLVMRPEKPMLVKQHPNTAYWYEILPEYNAVFVEYTSCREMDNYSFKQFTGDVMKAIDSLENPKLIIDLRSNGGGNSAIFAPMTKAILKRDGLNQKDKLFCLVGRRTFSSAILNAMDLRNKTNATLVGEPTGGKPNHFGEVKSDKLQNCGLRFTWSVKYFKVTDDDPDALIPDVLVESSIEDYRKGIDRALERIWL